MLDVKKNTPHAHPSLLQLRMALSAAESESPARPLQSDSHEQLALQLIQKIKTGYKKPLPFLTWNDIPSPYGFRESLHEMTVTHA